MKFRYKVRKIQDSERYSVQIQQYTGLRFFQWETVEEIELRSILWSLNDNMDYFVFHGVPASALYDELTKYSSMDEVIMKYILKEVLKDKKIKEHEDLCESLVDKFVLTNGWKTIEVEENEN